ncbi:SLC13 family permease [Gordonibacter faecis]|uniref:SLC13 family permease n=1 Tax=Gordonibacter faecis TaxID=3047475 RepID=A0ABT7DPV7_9ACTN|nr:SLC13 family permease [Gordonibacter sp. KGMB12511]MDJ1650195.1 SLC13 family permease [Gordonibacter sp. KGMB12511]HIW75971.1 citrate transporter [Candidatus Gordonibacter avicola]
MTSASGGRGHFRVRGVRAWVGRFVRGHVVLVVSAVAALVTMAMVPPDATYLGYFDLKTLACLFGILALVGALRGVGVFERAAQALVARFSTCRAAVAALVGSTLVLSMFATNDMALVMMLPLAAATLLRAGWERVLPFTFIMQNLAANLGGMILPFGNPQNLYLSERYAIPLGDFMATMALPFAVSMALIALCCFAFTKPEPLQPAVGKGKSKGEMQAEAPAEQAAGAKHASPDVFGITDNSVTASPEASVSAPAATPATPKDSQLSRRVRALAYGALLVLVIASVLRAVPYPVAFGVVLVALAVLDRRALKSVDLGLLLTFVCFFVFAGNMARIPAVEAFFSQAMEHSALLVSAGASQIISNVPAAVLLSHFTDSYPALLIGVNVGGAGTLVASLASLIAFNEYRAVRRGFPRREALARVTPGRYFVQFTVFNFTLLIVLLAVCLLII